jgi:methylglutaconyl-CoA hydratase
MTMNDTVLLNCDSRGIATITLNRPDKRNAFDDALIRRLHEVLDTASKDSSIRAVILTGAGTAFSAGADLAHMRLQGAMSENENFEDAHRFALCLQLLNGMGKPVIARVNGGAYGGGVGLIACADIAIGVDSAKFALTEVRFGIVPAVISPYVVAAIGPRAARSWFLTAMPINAHEALQMQLLHEVVANTELDGAVENCVQLLLQGGPIAQREAKGLVANVQSIPDEEAPAFTARLLARLRSSPEGKEGLGAFLSGTKPSWDKR